MNSNFYRGLKLAIPLSLTLWALIFASVAHAGDFSTETVVEESVYQALHAIDIAQTVYIAKHPDQFYEKEIDWAVGRHPAEARVLQYMVGDAALHVALTFVLVKADAPRWVTRSWELLTIGASANNVRGNYNVGIKARF
jgi:hypothetical protein